MGKAAALRTSDVVRQERNAAQADARRIEARLGDPTRPAGIPHAERVKLETELPRVRARIAEFDAELRRAILAESESTIAAAREPLAAAERAYAKATQQRNDCIAAFEASEYLHRQAWAEQNAILERISAANARMNHARDQRIPV